MVKPYKLTTVGVVLLMVAASGRAQSTSKVYLNVDAGPIFQQDMAINGGSGFITVPNAKIKFNTGIRAGAALGYNFNQSFAAELEGGIIRNTINQVGGQQLSSVGANAQLVEVPLLANCIYTLPLKKSFKPYIGIGVGTMIGIFDSAKIPGSGKAGSEAYNSTDFTFAYQAEVGLKYSLSKNVDLGIAYKFIGTTDHKWSDNNISLKTDGTMAHTIAATLTWRF